MDDARSIGAQTRIATMSQPTSPDRPAPSDGFSAFDSLTVAELGKGDPAPQAQRMSGILVGIGGQMALWALVIVVVLGFILIGCQQRV